DEPGGEVVAGHRADAGADCGGRLELAARRTAVAARFVAVVALLVGPGDAVSTACAPARAGGLTAVPPGRVAVVALLGSVGHVVATEVGGCRVAGRGWRR